MSKLIIDSGKSGQTIGSGVSAYVCSGATVTNFKVTSGGTLYIQSGCAAKNTIVSSGGALVFVSGCKPGSVNSVFAGGLINIGSRANVSSVTASNGAIVQLYAMANTTYTVTSNGATLKCTGSTFSDWDMKTSGNSLTLEDVTANNIKVSSGCSVLIVGCTLKTLNVYNGGSAYLGGVESLGLATVHAGGDMFVGDPAVYSMTVVENGGHLYFFGTDDAILANPECHVKIKANTFYDVTASGTNKAYKYVTAHSGTTGVRTTLLESACFDVFSGGRAYDTVISKGHLTVSSGGLASNVAVGSTGGGVTVCSGGKLTGVINFASGTLFVSSGGVVDFDISGIRGGDAPRFTNYYCVPTNVGCPSLTLTVSGLQPDGTYTLATGAWQLEKKTTAAEKTLTIYNTAGSKLGSVQLGQTAKLGSAQYSLNLVSGYLSVTISGSAPANPAKSDIDASNKSDILFQYTGGDYQTGYWMNGTNTWKGQGAPHDKKWKCLGAYDMNGNGKADTVYIGNVTVNGVKGAYIGYYENGVDADANWRNIGYLTNSDGIEWKNAVGNFTGTYARNDIVWHAPSLGVLGIWTDGTMNWKSLGSGFDSKWAVVGTGDFNGNGMDSILMSLDGGTNYYAVDVNGAITHMGFSSTGWKVVAIGDFYGDGKEDVIAFNETWGLVDVWSDGQTWVDVNIGQLNAKDWFVAGAGDYNGDGRDDLLVRQKSTGLLGYYSGADMKSGWKTLGYGVSNAWTVIA